MSAVVIGRAQALAAPTEWGGKTWDMQGERIRFQGAVYSTDLTAARVLRQQLIGHAENNDVVPVTSVDDPTIDGFYRVLGSSVSYSAQSPNFFPVSVDLERCDAYSAPLFESQLIGTTLTNGLGITGAPFHSTPQHNSDDDAYNSSATAAVYDRVTADGTIPLVNMGAYSATPQWHTTPAKWFRGAATIECPLNDRPVTGTQIQNDGDGWRIYNGLVIAGWKAASTTRLYVNHYDGTQYEAAKEYTISCSGGGGYTVLAPTAMQILRNDPAMVIVRTIHGQNHGSRLTIDWSLRRGDRWLRLYLQNRTAETWRCSRGTAEASTSITGGLRATSNDAGGNRYMFASALATTKDTTNGEIVMPSASTTFEVGIGMEIGGSGAAVPDYATGSFSMIEQYFADQSEAVTCVGR